MPELIVPKMIAKRIIAILGGLVYLPVFGFLLLVGIVNEVLPQVIFCVFALLSVCVLSYRLWNEKYLPKLVLGILTIFPAALWAFQTIRRIEFVIRERGMERANGYGSPLAFLIGVIGEGLIFALPAILLIMVAILHRNPLKTRPDGSINSITLRSTT